MTSDRTVPRLPRWPFFFADAVLLGMAYLIYYQSNTPMTAWQTFFCAACVSLGAVLGVSSFLIEYRAATRLAEADRLTNAVLQIENIEIIGRQITHATASWQTAHEHATRSADAAREIADAIASEARAFGEFLNKANDTEKNHLRLEVEKLRRAENEWLQILVRILDHVYALYQAAVRSGKSNLVEQLGHFQNTCRDVARRVGLVPFVAIPGEPYDSKVHQVADSNVAPAMEARVAETVATGYSFQGQLVRPALVALQPTGPAAVESPGNATLEPLEEAIPPEDQPTTQSGVKLAAAPGEETPGTHSPSAEPARELVQDDSPDPDLEELWRRI
jgi:molecular chaperone GrpE (heat shock protein)